VPRGYFAARRGVFEEYVEKGDFVKLRELSLSYGIDAGLLRRLGARSASGATLTIAGRNLRTWTDYTGWDPGDERGRPEHAGARLRLRHDADPAQRDGIRHGELLSRAALPMSIHSSLRARRLRAPRRSSGPSPRPS
jgi:hypothetical protein